MSPFENRLLSEHFAKINSFYHKTFRARLIFQGSRKSTENLSLKATFKKKIGVSV